MINILLFAIISDVIFKLYANISECQYFFAIISEQEVCNMAGLKERIKELCANSGISMNKLEEELGFGKGYISKLGISNPNTSKLQKIADYFSVTLDFLMTGNENDRGEDYYLDKETAKVAQKIYENKELRLLFDTAQDAPPEDLETVHSMLLALKRKERGDID